MDLNVTGPEEHSFLRMCFVLAGRLRVYAQVVEESIRGEYLHSLETIKDWRENLNRLLTASTPLYSYFRKCGDEVVADFNTTPLEFFRFQVQDSIRLLRSTDSDRDAGSDLFKVLANIRNAVRGLAEWQSILAADLQGNVQLDLNHQIIGDLSNGHVVGTRTLFGRYMQLVAAAKSAIQTGEEKEICMASRRLFLIEYYIATVVPQLWTEDLHAEVRTLHEVAKKSVPAGLAADSIGQRLRELNFLSPHQFQREITQFEAA